jgi:hypothetical protein
LEILGEADVPPERLAAKLVEIAEKFKELKTAAAAQPGDDAKITALKAEAQKAIQDGELGKADEFLAAIEKIQTEALDRLALNAAQTTAQRRCGLDPGLKPLNFHVAQYPTFGAPMWLRWRTQVEDLPAV